MAEFKDRLKQLREEQGYTREYIGQGLAKSGNYVARLEAGTEPPYLSELVTLYHLFDVSFAYLIGESDIRN